MDRRNFLGKSAAAFGSYCLFAKVPLEAAEEKSGASANPGAPQQGKSGAAAPFCDKSFAKKALDCDILVAGGGLAGICAALSAARMGAKVVLLQDRSRLGGNSSSEIRMHPLGMNYDRTGFREGGIIEELLLENLVYNPQCEWEVWDLLLYDKVVSEPNITLFLDTDLCGAAAKNNRIIRAYARSDSTRIFYDIAAKIFIDATGDSRLAGEVGAELMSGRDTRETYGESLSDYDPQGTRQGSTIMFTSRDYGREMPFKAPSWARKITPEMLKHRGISGSNLEYGYWWIELGGNMDAIAQAGELRHELLRVVLGVWDYIKNSGKFPAAKNRAIDGLGMLPGRRETFRVRGLYTMTEHDIRGKWKEIADPVAVGGWSMDDHPKEGFDAANRGPCRQVRASPFYNISLGSLISKDFENMMMAGRNISCSHVAFTSTRVMATCASVGQAAGTCAALSCRADKSPAALREDSTFVKELQQSLLGANQTIVGVKYLNKSNLLASAKITATSSAFDTSPENIINGVNIEHKDERKNRWIAAASENPELNITWNSPRQFSKIEFVFDSGARELTMSKSQGYLKRVHWGPQPEILRDFKIYAKDSAGNETLLCEVKDNWRKVLKLDVARGQYRALRVCDFATNGNPHVRIMAMEVS